MNKVGLISTHFAINYGAVLQAYALRKVIENIGYDCEIIDYNPNSRLDGNMNVFKFNNLRNSIYSVLLFLNFIQHRL